MAPAMVRVGDVINAEEGDYRRDREPAYRDSMGDLHLRVTHVPMDAGAYDTEWVTVRGIEKPMGKPELPEAAYAIRRRVLADVEQPAPTGPVW
ncbi:hypothetical protein [Micromonospora sp. NBC_01796]|uniref:hypothetical protein n=1 Tax=Micromonospora sp. NBC_01796 TaxID=2975987 RepID=UPI002DDB05AF|nr:hypothetical protein [Micromonospora sp. NBC_01796]WSA83274.1 hypothetical protein OIE47_23020 [Micromonospora sp. NBC_01796]